LIETTKNILIVDQKVQRRDMLASRFRVQGYTPDLANDGFHAISLVENIDYKSVILVGNPYEMSAIEVATILRDMIPKGQMQIIIVSHQSQQEDVLEAYKIGVNEYLLYDDKIFGLLLDKIDSYSPADKLKREFLLENQLLEASESAKKIDKDRSN